MFRVTRVLHRSNEKLNALHPGSPLQPRGTFETATDFFQACMSILSNPKPFKDYMQRRLIRPEISNFVSAIAPIVLYKDLQSFYNEDGKAKYKEFSLDEEFINGARGALENFTIVQWDMIKSYEDLRRRQWEASQASLNPHSDEETRKSAIRRKIGRKIKNKQAWQRFMKKVRKKKADLEKGTETTVDPLEVQYNWEHLAKSDPDSLYAHIYNMTTPFLFEKFEKELVDNVNLQAIGGSPVGGGNDSFLITSEVDHVEVTDVSHAIYCKNLYKLHLKTLFA